MTGPTSARTGYADINGAKLYYEISGSGPAVALLHAGIADSRMWDDQIAAFSERYTVIRYDYRCFGRSSMPPGEFSFRDDLRDLLRFLGIERTALVGVSIGGGLAIDFTLEFPEMVSALVAVAPGLSGFAGEEDNEVAALEVQFEAAQTAGDLERANDLEVHMWVDGLHRSPEAVSASVRERVREMNLASFKRQDEWKTGTSRRLDPPAAGRLGEIHVPTLVLFGDEDLAEVSQTVDAVVQGVSGAQRDVMHGTAHVPNMEQPDTFNQIVLGFLDSAVPR